jgi:hypothetical protein
MSVHITVRIYDREDVVVEGLCQVLNHWILSGQQLVQNVRHSGRRYPLPSMDSWTTDSVRKYHSWPKKNYVM